MAGVRQQVTCEACYATMIEQELMDDTSSILKATGDDLDRIAMDRGIVRHGGVSDAQVRHELLLQERAKRQG